MDGILTIQEIYTNISNDFKARLNLTDNDLKTVLDALALSLAAQFKLTYLALGDNLNQVFPDTADTSENGGTLDRLGRIYLNRNQRPATSGIFDVSVTGTAGSILRAGLTFKSNDDSLNPGQLYILDNEYTLTGTGDTIEIRSLEGGVDFNLALTNTLTITEPVIGADQIVTVTNIVQQALAAESTDAFRKAILDAIQLEPQGGAKTDYRLWAQDAQGVRQVYPYVKQGEAGTVEIYVEANTADSTDGLGTPTQAILDEVKEVIELDPDVSKPLSERGRRPIQANIETLAINPTPVDVEIIGLQDDSPDVKTSIENNIKAYLNDIRPFVAGGDLARNKNDILYSGRLNSTITDVLESNNFFTNLNMFVNGNLQVSFEFSRENIPFLNDLTFTP